MGLFLSASLAAAHRVWDGVGVREGALGQCLSRDPVDCCLSVPALLQLHKCRCFPFPRRDCLPGPFLQVCSGSQVLPFFHGVCRPLVSNASPAPLRAASLHVDTAASSAIQPSPLVIAPSFSER